MVLAATVAIVVAAVPSAAEAKSCNPPEFGDGYYYTLQVTRTTCAKGEAVARAYTKCRHASGGARGTCSHKVKHFSCTEERGASIPTEFDASVTCKRGRKRVRFAYQQNT